MTSLLIDTSGEYAVLALTDGGGALRSVRIFEGRRSLSRRLLGEVDGLLASESLTLDDVSAFGVGLGPGSFTGVRVGVTTAKTFAQVTGRPLVGVPTLDSYAAFMGSEQRPCSLVAVLPSRRGEVYAALYAAGELTSEPFAEATEALERRIEALEAQDPIVCCGAVGLLSRRPLFSVALSYTPPEGLARLAAQRLAEGSIADPLALTPLYIVPPAISTPRGTPK